MRSLGIDIGGSSIKATVLDQDSLPIASAQSVTYRRPDRDGLVKALSSVLAQLPRSGLTRTGVCAPGSKDPATGVITRAVNVPGLEGLSIRALLEAAGGCTVPVRQFTDAHAGAYDVYRQQRLSGRLLAISIGTGVGAAVLDEGRLVTVTGASSGHVGQMDVRVPEPARSVPVGPDGGRGSLEAYLGLPALLDRYQCGPDALLSAMQPADAPILALSQAIRICHAIYRPDHVRLLGGIGIRLGPFLPEIANRVSDGLTALARPGWTLGCCDSDFHAARGAASLALLEPP